ncbi:MAG: (4Fe-4S)-binding protein [Winogradskyella sp.]|uniref:(4Fe-4S)-binding protein n=1 Tax=Winogradskyella sp. TaxID=1883156 RepID=UPI0025CC9158|nr:(4Fe-4S)-binding protein [Winogradskyella sp.]NRB58855.1 (4Fe-4S)-binding protein [Winogradskyella sp.]
MKTNHNTYSNSDITVTYEPKHCVNAGLCAKQLSDVFRTTVIPWIKLDEADTNKIIEQIKKCPSGALKFHLNKKDVA